MPNTTARDTARTAVIAAAAALAATLLVTTIRPAAATSAASLAADATAVATVDLGRLLEGLDERATLEARVDAEIRRRQAQLDQVVTTIEGKQAELDILPEGDPGRIDIIRDLRLAEIEARALREFLQQEIALDKGRLLGQLYGRIQTAACEVAARDGWDLIVIDDSAGEIPPSLPEQQMLQLILSRRVLCTGETTDITDDVRLLMNNKFNAGR